MSLAAHASGVEFAQAHRAQGDYTTSMRFFRRKSDAKLLDAIIDRQDPRPRRPAPKAANPRRGRWRPAPPAGRPLTPFVIALIVCTGAAGYFVGRDWSELVSTYGRVTNQAQATPPSEGLTGRASIIDGDTIEIRGQRLRLWGVDAPESAQLCQRDGQAWRCGQAAALALSEWIGERTVICTDRGDGGWGRRLGHCRVGGADVSAWLVEKGWALAFRRYSLDYVANEDRARGMRAGIWDSQFMAPWEWRAARKGPQ